MRTISGFVPTGYDSTKSYALIIGLHGLGDNSTNYRNALVSSLNWASVFPNTIILCPDGGSDQGKDFYEPRGDEEIIDATIRYAVQRYHIDTQSIVLQGFSLGGRSALKYATTHTERFKGLILNTPAMQGIFDVRNDPNASLVYQYDRLAGMPVMISLGENDLTYSFQVPELVEVLKKNNVDVHYFPIKNMGHTIPAVAVTSKIRTVLFEGKRPHLDAEVFAIDNKVHYCSATSNKDVWVRNAGDSIITSLELSIHTGSGTTSYTWSGNLLPAHAEAISLPVSLAEGHQLLEVKVLQVNGFSDDDTSNNTISKEVHYAAPTNAAVVRQLFEGETPYYAMTRNNLFGWSEDEEVKRSGKASISLFSTPFLFYNMGAVEEFTLPTINLTSLTTKKLYFDMAFNYVKFEPPMTSTERVFADTLEILISIDCGATFSTVFKKGGKELATAAEPILNPGNLHESYFTPSWSEWRTEEIDLSRFAQHDKAILVFRSISGMGGTLNIDNISFGDAFVSVSEVEDKPISGSFYPNPATNMVTFKDLSDEPVVLVINDISGKEAKRTTISSASPEVHLSDLKPGMYVIQFEQIGKLHTSKLIVE
jgi:predicted esterase